MIPVSHGNMSVMIPSQDSMVLAAFEGSRNHGILWNLALRRSLFGGVAWRLGRVVPGISSCPSLIALPKPMVRTKGDDLFCAERQKWEVGRTNRAIVAPVQDANDLELDSAGRFRRFQQKK